MSPLYFKGLSKTKSSLAKTELMILFDTQNKNEIT